MFDLIVTYSSDNKITYQNTINNLHILDYDYYFKVTDHLLNKNHAAVLLTFEEILSRGFDGHNFIVGLGEHFRNLMVSKDKATVVLLQVSEGVKQKYYEQAQKMSLSYLLSALNLTNQCDLYYKSSKNQRLHVELVLMKLAHLSSAINFSTLPDEELKKKV
jgi:DNA polymerase-3 subunit gamma/tau